MKPSLFPKVVSILLVLAACGGHDSTPDPLKPAVDLDGIKTSDCVFYSSDHIVENYIKMADAPCLKKALENKDIQANGVQYDSFWNRSTPYIQIALDSSSLFFAKSHDAKSAPVIVALLLQYGADANRILDNKQSVLETALRLDSDYESVPLYLINYDKTDVNAASAGGTPLEVAIDVKHDNFVKALIGRGANVNKNTRGPLLFQALRQDLDPTLNTLLDAGADINAKDSSGDSIVSAAIQNKKKAFFDALVAKGAALDVPGSGGTTPLMIATTSSDGYFFDRLLELNSGLNLADERGDTALFFAVDQDRVARARALMAKKAEVSTVSKDDGSSLLHVVQSVDLARDLLDRGVSQITNRRGESPLSRAVSASRASVAALFIAKGGDTSWVDANGRSLLHLAVSNDSLETARVLTAAGLRASLLDNDQASPMLSVSSRAMAELLLANGGSVQNTNRAGFHVLSLAFKRSPVNLELHKYLISAGADLNADAAKGFSPLQYLISSFWGSDELKIPVVKFLLGAGAQSEAYDAQGLAPIHYVRSLELLKTFAEGGANLSLVSRYERRSLRKILVDERADFQKQIDDRVHLGNTEEIEAVRARYAPLIARNGALEGYLNDRGAQ